MDFIIRPAAAGDVAAINALNAECFDIACPVGEGKDRFKGIINSGGMFWVAESGGLVLGYLHAGPYPLLWTTLIEVACLAVTREARGRGVGRALLEAAEDWARMQGADGMRILSGFERKGAHGFYKRMGYGELSDTKKFQKLFGDNPGDN